MAASQLYPHISATVNCKIKQEPAKHQSQNICQHGKNIEFRKIHPKFVKLTIFSPSEISMWYNSSSLIGFTLFARFNCLITYDEVYYMSSFEYLLSGLPDSLVSTFVFQSINVALRSLSIPNTVKIVKKLEMKSSRELCQLITCE